MLCENGTGYLQGEILGSLNPCSNGRCSARDTPKITHLSAEVLILVLMEDALRVFTLNLQETMEVS